MRHLLINLAYCLINTGNWLYGLIPEPECPDTPACEYCSYCGGCAYHGEPCVRGYNDDGTPILREL